MQAMQQFCLRWNNHQPNFISVFTTLLSDETLVDVTLACEGKHLQAHRVVLSACSAYFQSLFTINPCQHPIVILKDIRFNDLKTMVDFMYHGEVNVSQDQLPAILKIAEMLKIKGLADMPHVGEAGLGESGDKDSHRSSSPMSPALRRKRLRKSSTGSGSGSTEQTSEEIVGEGFSGHSPSVRIEHVDDLHRSFSRQSLRNSHHEVSTDSEPKEGSQDSGAEEYKRQLSSESRQVSFESRQISIDSVPGSFEARQLSHESRPSSFNGRQTSHESRQLSEEGPRPQLSQDSRQTSHESRLSHESSVESVTTDAEGRGSNMSPSSVHMKIGTKRGKMLMRQQRIKKESDHQSPDSDPGSPGISSNLLSVPTVKSEKVKSEPLSSHPHSPPPPSSSLNLLTVPQPTFPVRQHSFPSQTPTTIMTGKLLIQRQLSQPPSSSAKSVQTTEESRSLSPSFVVESLPIVRIISESEQTNRSVHTPVERTGSALGCNYCWNTIDDRGRILRRKTKFHCPECNTNLCIVPCFQDYHQRQTELPNKQDQQSSAS